MDTQQQLIKKLEPLVDAAMLENVLFALARMCNEKAEHLRVNWQDSPTANAWDKAAQRIDACAVNKHVEAVS